MTNTIPRAISRNKILIWRNVGIIEILIIVGWFSLSGILLFGLPINKTAKIILILLSALLSFPLIFEYYAGLKGWKILLFAIKYAFSPKRYQKNGKNDTLMLIPYQEITDEYVIKTEKINGKNWYVSALKVKGFNILLLNQDEYDLKIKSLQDVFRFCEFPLTMLKLNEKNDFSNNINFLSSFIKKNNDLSHELQSRQTKLKNNIEFFEAEKEKLTDTTNSFYFFVYGKNQQELAENTELLSNKLLKVNLKQEKLVSNDIVNKICLLWNPLQQQIEDEKFIDSELNEVMSFDKFLIAKDYIRIDQKFLSISAVYDYPYTMPDLWGALFANNDQSMVWNINPINQAQAKIALNKAINNSYTKQFMTKSHVVKNKNEYEIQAYRDLINDINGQNEKLKKCNIFFISHADELGKLKKLQHQIKKVLKENSVKLDELKFRQLEGFSACTPKNHDPLMEELGREIPAGTLANSFPFLNSGLNEKEGIYLGKSNTGDNIIFDPFNPKRKNNNQIIIGTSGSGKSFATKKIASFHLNLNRNVIIIDPEREYKRLCEFYGGQWIDTGDASNGRINPLQVLDNDFKSDNESKKQDIEQTHVSNHLRLLGFWFKTLYPDFNERELSQLIKQIKLLYQDFQILDNIELQNFANTDFPLMTDLIKRIENNCENKPVLKEWIDILKTDFVGIGKYSKLWNNHTTLKFNNDFVVYDVLTLFDQDDSKVVAAQLCLVLAFIKGKVKSNRFENKNKLIIIVDEAHLVIDKNNPVALNFIYQMVKRIRKYNGSIIITTQNINDFTGTDEIKKKTTAIINNTQYSLILNLAPGDLKDVNELYRSYGGLTENERDYIARGEKGEGLMVISGYERYCVKVKAIANEAEYF